MRRESPDAGKRLPCVCSRTVGASSNQAREMCITLGASSAILSLGFLAREAKAPFLETDHHISKLDSERDGSTHRFTQLVFLKPDLDFARDRLGGAFIIDVYVSPWMHVLHFWAEDLPALAVKGDEEPFPILVCYRCLKHIPALELLHGAVKDTLERLDRPQVEPEPDKLFHEG